MKIGLYGRPEHEALAAFAHGAKAVGHVPVFQAVEVFTPDQREPFDAVVVSGVNCAGARACVETYHDARVPTYLYDIGHIHRTRYHRIVPNTLYYLPTVGLRDRFDALGIQPFAGRGQIILVCGDWPLGVPHRLPDHLHNRWVRDMMPSLRAATQRRIVYRPHPAAEVPQYRTDLGDEVQHPRRVPIRDALAQAWAVITRWGGVGTDAILAGVPVICDPLAFYAEYAVAHHVRHVATVEPLPDAQRIEFGSRLAATQYTVEELSQPDTVTRILGWH